eukprot:scaffold62938_cov15-Tisochrysis_lutea.AAC.2
MRVLWDGKETCHEEAHGSTRKTLMVECCCAFRDFPRDLLALGPKDHLKISSAMLGVLSSFIDVGSVFTAFFSFLFATVPAIQEARHWGIKQSHVRAL